MKRGQQFSTTQQVLTPTGNNFHYSPRSLEKAWIWKLEGEYVTETIQQPLHH